MNQYPILQSGFIGLDNNGLVNVNEEKSVFINYALDKDYLKRATNYFYSSEVTNLYEEWRHDSKLIEQFSFRERIIKASKILGTPTIRKWFILQLNQSNVTIGDLHIDFLYQTLDFISGKHRPIEISQWIRILTAVKQSTSVKVNFNKYFDSEIYGSNAVFSSTVTTSIIQQWLSQVGGFEDLLLTLYVIFGNRPYITDVVR